MQRGETEYGIKAIPAGGFVKIIGMTSVEVVPPEDEPRAFRRFPGWQRVIVLSAGSAVHFILAFLLIFGLALGIGIENDASTQLGTISTCVPANATALDNDCPCPRRRAQVARRHRGPAGGRPGHLVRRHPGGQLHPADDGDQARQRRHHGADHGAAGREVADGARHARGGERPLGGFLGIAGASVFQSVSPLRAVTYGGSAFWQVLSGSAQEVGQLPAALPDLFKTGPKGRDSTAAGNVTSIVGVASATGQAVAAPVGWQDKVSFVLLLIASLNIFWGAFNLFPLLPLDGGHIAIVFYERIRSRIARWRRRPDPGMADYMKFIPVSFSLFSIILVISVILILADIVNPVNIG